MPRCAIHRVKFGDDLPEKCGFQQFVDDDERERIGRTIGLRVCAKNVFQLSMRKDVGTEPPGSIAFLARPLEFVFGGCKTLLIQP